MKVAYCLYGQPRNLIEGYKIISKFVKKYNPDFYYHTWTLPNENERYTHSHYRYVNDTELQYDKNIENKINSLYNPISYSVETSKIFNGEEYSDFVNSVIYLNTEDYNIVNISNTISQFYSRQKVRDLLYNEIIHKNIKYDFVISSRFDTLKEINIDLNILDKNKFYVSNMHIPRYIFADHTLISNVEYFLNVFNVYNNLNNIIHNHDLNILVNKYNEKMIFVPETLLFSNYLYYYGDLKNVEYIDIPNFW